MSFAARNNLDLSPLELPSPLAGKGASLHTALQQRKTIREMQDAPLSRQVLADLLWAAYGVNRKQGPFGVPGRTAASASNSQEIDLYVLLAEGAFLYDASGNRLIPAASGDWRHSALTPGQRNVDAKAPVQLIYVVDLHKLTHTAGYQEPGLLDAEIQKSYYYVDTGLIAGNVYLYAAAEGLTAWFHNCDRSALSKALGLGPEQRVLFAQSVGYPVPT